MRPATARVRPPGVMPGLVALGLLVAGCRPRPEIATEPPIAPTTATPRTTPRQPPAPAPRATAIARAPVELLPEGTAVAVTAASAQHVLRVVDIAALVTKYRVQYDQAAAYVEQATGHNLLDPRRWTEVGVDPDGPVGGALLDVRAEAFCLYFTVSDPQRFRDFLDRMGAKIGGQLDPVFEDRGIVLAHESGAQRSLVLRDGFAFFVAVDDPNHAPYDFARELASVDPARGLAASERWKKALGAAPPRDLVAFVDAGAMIRAEVEGRAAEPPAPSWAEGELQRLREQGAPAEEVARWQQLADEQRAAEARYRERRRREQELWSAVFAPLGPLVFELSLGERAISGTVRAQAPESSLLRRIVAGRGAPPLALTAAGERVLFGTGVAVDVAEAAAGVELLLRLGGKDLDGLAAELKRELGVDLRAALAAVDGALSFAVTVKDAGALATAKGRAALGFNLAIGLKDPAAGQALVEALAGKLAAAPAGLKVRRAGSRGHVVTVPQWREVHVAVVGTTLAASTEPEFVRRVEREARGPIERTLPAAVVPVVTEREAAAAVTMDWLLPIGMLALRGEYGESWDPTRNQPYWRFPQVAHAAIDAVLQSAAYKAKLREWQRIEAKIRRSDELQERRRAGLVIAAAESVGSLALNLRETGEGLALTGGQYFGPGGLARAIETAIEAASGPGSTDYSLHEERGRVEREMQEIRVRDLERALGVRPAQ